VFHFSRPLKGLYGLNLFPSLKQAVGMVGSTPTHRPVWIAAQPVARRALAILRLCD
jgi:hypothetical protein